MWTAVGVLSLLIVASRKHYSVDVLIAWYCLPCPLLQDVSRLCIVCLSPR